MIKGFSKLTRQEKTALLLQHCKLEKEAAQLLQRYLHDQDQALFDDISENTLSNFFLPYGVAPNFRINHQTYMVPMVTEESSVVAAAAKAAGFWAAQGGFHSRVIQTTKEGQILFTFDGTEQQLNESLPHLSDQLVETVKHITVNMEKRGGGIGTMTIAPIPNVNHTWQLRIQFETADSMGANFINSCLEEMAVKLKHFLDNRFPQLRDIELIMAILSNHTPECLVECKVTCPVSAFAKISGNLTPIDFAYKFERAVLIAQNDVYRAVTHNKGIMNGVDAVVIATGNDFRAVEAAVHAYAALGGKYKSLSSAQVSNDQFTFTLTLPLSLGTVGGLTGVHPLARFSMNMLQNPTAKKLMEIVAAVGIANNFMAVTALITQGIQKGHMKLHLSNVLNSLQGTPAEKELAFIHFQSKTVSYSEVNAFIQHLRKND